MRTKSQEALCADEVAQGNCEEERRTMIAMRGIERVFLGALAAGVLAVLGTATPAHALSPWWHLSSGSRPSTLQQGLAADEVQEVKVKATAGEFILSEPSATGQGEFFKTVNGKEEPEFAILPFDATAQEVQEGLEGIYGYGAGSVEVSGGPGDVTGSKPYVVKFVGPLADQSLQPISTGFREFVNLTGEESVAEQHHGRPDGYITVTATNLGDAGVNGSSTPFTIADKLPVGLRAVGISGVAELSGANGAVGDCSLQSLACAFTGTLAPYFPAEVNIAVVVEAGASSGALNQVNVSGGEAPPASRTHPVDIGGEPRGFGVEEYELRPEEAGGALDTQAGSHPFQLTTSLVLNQTLEADPVALTKDLHFKIPPGLVGNPTPFPQCTLVHFLTEIAGPEGLVNECAPQTAVGVAIVSIKDPAQHAGHGVENVATFSLPLFNIEPSTGEPARFGFNVIGTPVFLDTSVRTGGDYGITVDVDNISEATGFLSTQVTFWGVPGDERHNLQRGWTCIQSSLNAGQPCKTLEASGPPPLLTLPTVCSGAPMQSMVEADSWALRGVFGSVPSEPMPSLDGCNRLPFTPSVRVTPDGQAGSTPTGLTVDEHVPQGGDLNPTGLAEAGVKGLSVTLPEGVALNPAAADGLQACTEAQIGLQSSTAPSCPEASKVANVKIKTPLLPNPLEGAAYLATQDANPFGSLVALYVSAEDPISGVRAKAAGEVLENPATGQLTAHFEGDPVFQRDPQFAGDLEAQFLPELPFEDVELHFFGGDRAPLATPARCGSYTTRGTFLPWSGNPMTESTSTFEVTSGPNATPCQDPLPFVPSLTAGTTSIQAGGFSPFTMTMSRGDGNQSLGSIKLRMPPGLLGTLSAVKLCGEAQADAGTCGPESLIGHTIVSVGVGADPFSVTGGEVFITGPYEGAPYGLSIVNPAKAGPFDLGKVVVRAKIEVDPSTAALTITTDESGPYAIPSMLQGIPLQIQHVNVSIDRPGFTFNPTNCSPLAITGSLTSGEGASASLSVPFQATNCAVLAFKPKLSASASGRMSRADGTSFKVKLSYPAGPYDANIARVKVELPKQLPSRLPTLQKACPAGTFEANPAGCPAASIIGHATATTPVLPVPLSGPAYFVSHGGAGFPSLVVVLQGYGVTVDLVGATFISNAGITSSTFKTVPDVPVGTFELTLPQGPYSALTANTNLCKVKSLAMPTEFIGQNGALIKASTKIQVNGCPKTKKKTTHKPKHHPTNKKNTKKHNKPSSAKTKHEKRKG
jgi:hypothetical protein